MHFCRPPGVMEEVFEELAHQIFKFCFKHCGRNVCGKLMSSSPKCFEVLTTNVVT